VSAGRVREIPAGSSPKLWTCSLFLFASRNCLATRIATGILFILFAGFHAVFAASAGRPNILWITSEDNGPQLGCYGDTYARTPNLDRLATKGMIYLNAWSTAPVCAPARTAIIMGMYPATTGGQHMRSQIHLPAGMKMYPQFLREAGYYCSNNSKEDYNLEKPGQVWDESSPRAHWKNRKSGQPFFAIFNHVVSHESQVRIRPHQLKGDPARVPLPPYHPDTPDVRHDWTQYYDKIGEMDTKAGETLSELEAAGLAEDTIIFYYGDHGSGMPRSKRWLYNSGLRVPLIVYFPPKYRHLAPKDYQPGGKSDRLVGFVDLAPTLLSVVGIEPPESMQGRAFAGRFPRPAPKFLFGGRDRMDERIDLVRTVRDERYHYIRNCMPHRIYGQHINYMFQTPTTRVWKQLYDEGRLQPPQTFFWEPKPAEELYDLASDPHEVRNLVGSPEHQNRLKRFRKALKDFVIETHDLGFLPEAELHSRSTGSTPYELGRDDKKYPVRRIFETADLASMLKAGDVPKLKKALGDPDSAVRYWAASGLLMRGRSAVESARDELRTALSDASPVVRIAAAEALGKFGDETDLKRSLDALVELAPMDRNGVYVSIQALNALDELDEKAASVKAEIKTLPTSALGVPQKLSEYVPRLIQKTLVDLKN